MGRDGGNSAYLNKPTLDSPFVRQGDDGLGFLRGYVSSIGLEKGFSSKKVLLSDLGFFLANPRVRRFFSSEAPKKKSKISSLFLSVIIFVVIVPWDSLSRFEFYRFSFFFFFNLNICQRKGLLFSFVFDE